MNLPRKMKEMLEEEKPEFRQLFQTAYEQIEKLGLIFHPQESPNVMAEHPLSHINCIALWIRGRKGGRRIEGEVRVDGYPVDILATVMRDEFVLRKFDRGKKPLWWLILIKGPEDVKRLCLITKRVISRPPNWGAR